MPAAGVEINRRGAAGKTLEPDESNLEFDLLDAYIDGGGRLDGAAGSGNGNGVLAGRGASLRLGGDGAFESRASADPQQERAKQEEPEQGSPRTPPRNEEQEDGRERAAAAESEQGMTERRGGRWRRRESQGGSYGLRTGDRRRLAHRAGRRILGAERAGGDGAG
jgi:hypothetical protein